ncbi:ribosomal RNA small subunit methyltransferase A [bacterium]|nr:MAG: ribosomal RNA small subunit methyltransferase A [bacterium]
MRKQYRFGTPAYGQHFLHDKNLLSLIVSSAELNPGDQVLEIGVGTGKLTRVILDMGASVTGVEIDRSLADQLEKEFAGESFRLVRGDILKVPWESFLPESGRLILMGNLPYAVSTQVIFRIIDRPERISRAVFLVQWEVGRRLSADPGTRDFGILSVACQMYGKPEILRKVGPGVFLPPPKVDSALVRWDVLSEPAYPLESRQFTTKVVRAAFGKRRKKIVNSLASGLPEYDKSLLKDVLTEMGIPEGARAEHVTVEQYAELSNRLYKLSPGNEHE